MPGPGLPQRLHLRLQRTVLRLLLGSHRTRERPAGNTAGVAVCAELDRLRREVGALPLWLP